MPMQLTNDEHEGNYARESGTWFALSQACEIFARHNEGPFKLQTHKYGLNAFVSDINAFTKEELVRLCQLGWAWQQGAFRMLT